MQSNTKEQAVLKRVIVAFYEVPEYGSDSVETDVVGNPAAEYAALDNAILKKHTKFRPGQLRRTGSVIELRSANAGFITYSPGGTLRQIFEGLEPGAVPSRQIGRVFFAGSPYSVQLIYSAGGQIKVMLHPRLAGHSPVNFSNILSGQSLVEELPGLIREVLGSDAKGLELNLRKVEKNKL